MRHNLIQYFVAMALGALTLSACNDKIQPDVDPNQTIIDILGKQDKTVRDMEINSPVIGRKVLCSIWLPPGYDASKQYPFLYLLHGYTENNNTWLDSGGAAAIAKEYVNNGGTPMVIVMPNGMDSFYMDTWAMRYETFLYEDLIPEIEKSYHGNGLRAIAGLSMGGFGTLYHALKNPDKFTYAYAMSPVTNFGDFRLSSLVRKGASVPPITIESGNQDELAPMQNIKDFTAVLDQNDVKYKLVERDGNHDWKFWPDCLRKALPAIGESFK